MYLYILIIICKLQLVLGPLWADVRNDFTLPFDPNKKCSFYIKLIVVCAFALHLTSILKHLTHTYRGFLMRNHIYLNNK